MAFLIYTEEAGWAKLSIHRPEALNALNEHVLEELKEILQTQLLARPRQDLKGVLVTGAGSKAFVAGADIKSMSHFTPEQALAFSEKGQAVFNLLEQVPLPVVALVHGFALGGGLELALACDWIYASPEAVFALPEVSLGLIPGFGGTVRLAQKIGLPRAMEMILTGKKINAEQALSWGLVNAIFPASELLSQAQQALSMMASNGPRAVAQAKRTVLLNYKSFLEMALQQERESFSDVFQHEESQEGMRAFLEKRKPAYTRGTESRS